MQAPYKEQKASNAVHLFLYFNVLSCRFTIVAFPLDISFWVVMQHTSPLGKGKKRGLFMPNWGKECIELALCSVLSWLLYKLLSDYAAHLSPYKGEKARGITYAGLT